MRMRSKEQECLTTRSFPKRETSMESSAGSKTSMSNSQRITTSCIHPTVSSLMDQRTIIISLTTLLSQILSSSAKTLHKAQSLDYQTNRRWQALKDLDSDHTGAVDQCNHLRHSPSLEAQCMLHLSSLIKTKPTSIELWMMLRRLWKLQLRFHSWGPKLIQKHSAKPNMVHSWASTWTIDHIHNRKVQSRSNDSWRSVKMVGTALSSQSQSTTNKCIHAWRSHSSRSEYYFPLAKAT